MSESNYKPDGTGVVMGDTKAMPDRGTRTGMPDNVQNDGKSFDPEATNSMGAIKGTGSDPMDQCRSSADKASY
jgi:hypothetical protein